MAPIHETDVAEERWAKSSWQHYELWEKIEVRLRRKRWLWIVGTVLVFLVLSAIPILIDRWPKWSSLGIGRRMASEINSIKRLAATEHAAFRIKVSPGLSYRLERAARCSEPELAWNEVSAGDFLPKKSWTKFEYSLVDPARGVELGIPGLISTFCYDPFEGSGQEDSDVAGFAIAPVKDLAEGRTDRTAIVLLSGKSAESVFE